MNKICKSYKFLLVIVLVIFCNSNLKGQYYVNWQKTFGGNLSDWALSTKMTNDSSIYVMGLSYSNDTNMNCNHGSMDFWLLKLDNNGNLHWQNCFGGSNLEQPNCINSSIEGGFVACGIAHSNNGDVTGHHGNGDFWIINIDTSGVLNWQKCFGGSQEDLACDVLKTTDSSYVIGGYTFSDDGNVSSNYGIKDLWIIKIDINGNLIWDNNFGGSDLDGMRCLKPTFDNGFIATGYTASNDFDAIGNHGDFDILVIKIDSAGNKQWSKCYGGTSDDISNYIIQTSDSNYVILGEVSSNDGDISGNHGSNDLWIAKIDDVGNIIWQKCYGGSSNEGGSFAEECHSIIQKDNGNFIVAANTLSNDGDVSGNHGEFDAWVIEIDSVGNLLSQKCFGGSEKDIIFDMIPNSQMCYTMVGSTTSSDLGLPYLGFSDYWVVSICSDSSLSVDEYLDENLFKVYPNPSNSYLEIEILSEEINYYRINIMNLFGQKVKSFEGRSNSKFQKKLLDLSELIQGVYILELEWSNGKKVVKIIKN